MDSHAALEARPCPALLTPGSRSSRGLRAGTAVQPSEGSLTVTLSAAHSGRCNWPQKSFFLGDESDGIQGGNGKGGCHGENGMKVPFSLFVSYHLS